MIRFLVALAFLLLGACGGAVVDEPAPVGSARAEPRSGPKRVPEVDQAGAGGEVEQ